MNTESTGRIPQTRPIVVGVDDSESSIAAVRWATEEAVARGLPLELLHVTPYDHPVAPGGPRGAQSILARGRTVARRQAEGVQVSTRLITGTATDALRKASTEASLLVLGLIGGGRADEVLVGSTTLAVSGSATCPVVGVRSWPPPASTHGEIVVGIDADTEQTVLDAAFAMAAQRGRGLVVLHCTSSRDPETSGSEPVWLHEQLAQARRRHPDVKVVVEVHTGGLGMNITNTLLRQSARAEAVVVGSHDRGPAARMLMGSTSRGLLRHSQVPVVVIGPQVGHSPAEDRSGSAAPADGPVPVAGGSSSRRGG
jgi:nucleotide-binding universal stress UspA family protein